MAVTAGMSTYLEQAVLNQIFNATSFSFPGTLYFAAFSTVPTASGGTELTGGSYARVAVTANTTNFPVATGNTPALVSNGTAIAFPTATTNWLPILGFGIFDAATSGHLLVYGSCPTVTVASGNTFSFVVGAFVGSLL